MLAERAPAASCWDFRKSLSTVSTRIQSLQNDRFLKSLSLPLSQPKKERSKVNFPDTQLFGALIGGCIGFVAAMGATLITQIFTSHRHKMQLAHERERENRARRTAALAEFQTQLREQASAVQNLWGFVCHPDLHYSKSSAEEAWDVLFRKIYRSNVWSIESPVTSALVGYSDKVRELLTFLRQQESFSSLWAGEISDVNEELRGVMDEKFGELASQLNTVTLEATKLEAKLNDIPVRKVT